MDAAALQPHNVSLSYKVKTSDRSFSSASGSFPSREQIPAGRLLCDQLRNATLSVLGSSLNGSVSVAHIVNWNNRASVSVG